MNYLEIDDEDLIDDEKVEQQEQPFKHKWAIYVIPILIFILVIVIVLIMFLISNNSEEEQSNLLKKKIGSIKCMYKINNNSKNSKPISNEYLKQNEFELYVEGLKIKNYNNFEFSKIGTYNVEIVLYGNEIFMDSMFKYVISLTDIQMITSSPEEKVEITSMKNTFENCKSLTSITLVGFHTMSPLCINYLAEVGYPPLI